MNKNEGFFVIVVSQRIETFQTPLTSSMNHCSGKTNTSNDCVIILHQKMLGWVYIFISISNRALCVYGGERGDKKDAGNAH